MSVNLTDTGGRLSDEELNRRYVDNQTLGDLAARGLRAGTAGMRAQANKLAGTVMEATGFDGSARNAAAAQAMAEAREAGSTLVPLEQVDGLRSGVRWATGAIGASAPMAATAIGASLLTGGAGAIPAALAGGAAMAPFEAGEMLLRQDKDPVAAGKSAAERLGAVALPALGAAAVQSVVPAGVAARITGGIAGSGLRQAAARGAVDVPMEAVGEGGAEGIRQFADNRINPNAGYDLGEIGRAAAEGAALGGVYGGIGATAQAVRGSADTILAAPGRAIDAAKGLMPPKAPEGAVATPGGPDGPTPPAPDLVDRASAALDDIPGSLRKLYEQAQDTGRGLLDKLAAGQETADPNDPDPVAATARADQTALERSAQWVQELLRDGALSKVDADALKKAAGNLGDRANQQFVAGLKQAQDAAYDARRAVDRFVKGFGKDPNVVDVEARVKKSEDYSGANREIVSAVTDVLGQDHPALKSADTINRLADGLRPFIQDVASGKVFDSMDKLDQLVALFDVTGDQTTPMLSAVHKAVSGAAKDETSLYRTLNQIEAVRNGRQGVLETMQKNLRPELQGVVRTAELKQEVALLDKWARTTGSDGKIDPEKAKFLDGQVRRALEVRYGDKAQLVMDAVQANARQEQNMLQASRVQRDEEGNPIGAEDGDMPRDGVREGVAADETAQFRYFAQNGQLYPDPATDTKASAYGSAATQRMLKAQKENPGAAVRFVKASELGPNDPMVKAKMADLMDEADQLGLSGQEAQAWATKNLDRFGVVAVEQSRQPTEFTLGEMAALRIDPKFRDTSPSRLKLPDGSVLDATRITEAMNRKSEGEYTAKDDEGARDARMFAEGIAAIQARIGAAFDVPPQTQITRQGLTWGDAQKRLKGSGKSSMKGPDNQPVSARVDDQVKELTRRKDEMEAEIALNAQSRIEEMKSLRVRLSKDNVREAWAEARAPFMNDLRKIDQRIFELERENVADDTAGKQQADPAGFEGEMQRGIVMNQPRMREIEADLAKLDNTTAEGRAREAALMEEFGRLSIGRNASTMKGESDLGSGRTEIDPFGPTLDVTRGNDDFQGLFAPSEEGGAVKPPRVAWQATPAELAAVKRKYPDHEVRSSNARQAKILNDAAAQLRDAFGSQLDSYVLAVLGGDDAPNGRLYHEHNVIAVHARGLRGDSKSESIIRVLAHELAHARDKDLGWASERASSLRPGGAAFEEARSAAGRNAMLGRAYKNVFDGSRDDAKNARELYAQLVSMFHAYPGVMREFQPQAYATIEAATNRERAAYRAAVSDTRGSEGGSEGTGVEAVPGTDAAGGRSPRLPGVTDGGPPSPKAVAAKKAAFLERARSGDAELLKSLAASDDAKGLQRAIDLLADQKDATDPNVAKALEAAQDRLRALLQEQPDLAYGMQTKRYSLDRDMSFDMTGVKPGKRQQSAAARQKVMDYLMRTHGNSVSVAWANIMHAGEFERTATGDVIRLSIHSLNPLSAAYHESLHAFFAKLRDMGKGSIMDVLQRAAESEATLAQLRNLLKGKPEALKQLSDPEERAAYMYQFWAQGKLRLAPAPSSLFGRIAEFVRAVTGIWTNDQRAEKIMEYFHSGDFEANRSSPSAVDAALMEAGRNRALDQMRKMVKPLANLGEAIAVTGGERLRASGIPALRDLADAMKLRTTAEGDDPGFVPASRYERSRLLNQLGMDLRQYSAETLREATEAMQNGVRPASTEARIVAKIVQRRLDEVFNYMRAAGVKVDRLGMKDGVQYFPRVWDAVTISKNQTEFLNMIEKYVRAGKYKGDPKQLMQRLMVTDGGEFGIEVERPGMQFSKHRVLNFISHADAAPFMRKNLFEIMDSYITQATRRAEWARRFDDDGARIGALLSRAAQEGATADQLATAHKFIRAVDGTLGDTIDPTARRMMGNMIVYQNIRLLPLAIFSSTVDSGGVLVRGGTVSEAFSTFKRGIREVVKNFQRNATNDWATELAEAIGTIDDAVMMREIGTSYSQGMVGDTARKINDTFFRYNLMEQYNRSMRVGATEAAMNFIVRHAMKPGVHSQRFLSELGLTAADVKLAPAGRLAVLESDGLTLEESIKMKAAVNRWVDGAVLRPDAVDKPLWMSDPHFALIAHLKQFVFAFQETILKRVIHEAKNGNYTPAMGLAGYVPMMIAADAVKGVIQGGGEEPEWRKNWGVSDYVASGIERAGLLGVGQFGLDAFQGAQRSSDAFVGSLMGPTIEQLTEAVQTLGGTRDLGSFVLKSLPANALYSGLAETEPEASARVL